MSNQSILNQAVKKPHVVIVGAGFGGLRAARSLDKKSVQVTLIDRNNFHLFQPLLYQVATAGLSASEIAYPLRGIFGKQKNLRFRMAEVEQVDFNNKQVITNHGNVAYDYLILSPGSQTNFFGIDTVIQHAFDLKNIEDANEIRNHILYQFEMAAMEEDPDHRKAMLTFVVVGGGPTGVELAGAISELVRLVLPKDFPDINFDEVRIILLEALPSILNHLDPQLATAGMQSLEKKGVEVHLGKMVTGYDGATIDFKGGGTLSTHTLIWAAGVKAVDLAGSLPVDQKAHGRIEVYPTLQLPEHDQVYVIGDSAYLQDADGNPYPMMAPVAMQQAEHAVENILRSIKNQPMQPFHYRDLGSMSTIGRNQAVAEIGKFHFTGFFAWLVWLFVHLLQLVGFRNRLVVMLSWIWEYLTYERAVRLIYQRDQCKEEA